MTQDPKATGGDGDRVPVALDGDLLRRIIQHRFPRGVSDFLDTWHSTTTAGGRPFTKAPNNRATVYRWMNGDLPGSAETLAELSAVLGVDPFSLFRLNGNDPSQATARILTALETGLWQHKAMAILSGFLGRRADWPPTAVGARYPGGWHLFEFEHDPEVVSGIYGHFQVRFEPDVPSDIPRIVHIAYRHRPHFGGRWLQYGFVHIVEKTMTLININGSVEIGGGESVTGPFAIETVFGLGPAEFRLASLTPFTATGHREPSEDPGKVGFR